jgi:hypothetical protein
MRRVPVLALVGTILLATHSPALAADTSTQTGKIGADPNEKVCETLTTIGSRIGAKKICATRAEWAQRRKADRDFAEGVQHGMGFNRCTEAVGGSRKGTPSC